MIRRRPAAPALPIRDRASALLVAAACLLPLLLQLGPQMALAIAMTGVVVVALSLKQPIPAPLRLILALAVLGAVLGNTGMRFGRDTGCALLAAMIAIKPSETFSLRDARSLIGFALFAPFATFLLDQGPLSLVLGLVAALAALMVLARLAESEVEDAAPSLSALRRLGQIGRLLAIGLPLALAAFWLFPRLAEPIWGIPERAQSRPGLSGRMAPGDWIDMLADDTVTLRVRFFGATPKQSQMYWRGPVLWDFDGRTWREARWMLPIPQVQPSALRWDYEMELEASERREVVALEMPMATPDGAALDSDYVLQTPRPMIAITRWRLQSSPPAVFEERLPVLARNMALALPEGYNPRALALSRQWRREAGHNDAAIVQRSLAWIRREFNYSIAAPPLGRHTVDEFLFETKTGYCEHFAGSFVVLMRGAGVPARVVTGYAGGYRNPIGDYWLVRRSDAHAWAEVWLPRRGWVRVDPTAAVAPERIYDTLADRAPGASGLLGALPAGTGLLNLSDWMRRGWNDFVLGFNAQRQQNLLRPLGIERLDPMHLTLLFAGTAALALLWMAWLSTRGPRETDPVLRAWHRLNARYRRLGLERAAHETATAWAERVRQQQPEWGDALVRLTRRFSDWRYAPGSQGRHTAAHLVRDLRAHRPRTHLQRQDARSAAKDADTGEPR